MKIAIFLKVNRHMRKEEHETENIVKIVVFFPTHEYIYNQYNVAETISYRLKIIIAVH